MSEKKDTIVIGGGVIGAACAYFLRKKGWEVTILEKGDFGEGSSYGNCGLILPGHVLPLNIPGTVTKAMKWAFRKNSPLYIKPRFDPGLFLWLMKFASLCTEKHVMHASSVRATMLKNTINLFENLISEEKMQCDWKSDGVLFVFKDKEGLVGYESIDRRISKFASGAQLLDKKELLDLEPSLSEDVAGAWFEKDAAHLRPDFLMKEFKRVLSEMGVKIVENAEVKSFLFNNEQVREVVTEKGNYSADEFVLTTGAWTGQLARKLGLRIPIQPGKGYSITLPKPAVSAGIPCILEEAKVVATPWSSGYRIGGTMEFSGFNEEIDRNRLESLLRSMNAYFKQTEYNNIKEQWCGWRPMTYDGLPVIDRMPGFCNMTVAAGHNMVGISMAPATGQMIAELINGETPVIDMKPFSIRRF